MFSFSTRMDQLKSTEYFRELSGCLLIFEVDKKIQLEIIPI